jgi:non-heme chloroperoxidase
MSIRSLRHMSRVLLLPLLTFACSDNNALAAQVAKPQAASRNDEPLPALTAEKIVGGGGLNMAVYETGNAGGPPIVFIHGFTGSYLSWQNQFARPLAADFRLVAYDLRGHGASDKPLEGARYTDPALWADDLDALIRAKNLDRPVLVGWSYGGYVMADYVRKFGDSRIGGLVFVGAVTKQGTPEAAGFLTDEVLALFGDVLGSDVRKSIDGTRALTRMFTHPTLRGINWEVSYGSAMMVPPEVRLAMFSRVLDNDDVLRGVRVPTLVIQGAADAIVRMSAAKHIASTIPGAQLLVYEGVGHAPFIESATRFGRDLAQFVRTSRR